MSVLSVMCCQRSLRRTDHSSRGVLPTVAHRCVRSGSLDSEVAVANWGLLGQKKQTNPSLKVNGHFISVTAVIDDAAFELLNFVSSDMSWSFN